MHIKQVLCSIYLSVLLDASVMADSNVHEHGGQIFHAFKLTTGTGINNDNDNPLVWNFDGWIGSDDNKLWLKSEGERVAHKVETAEFSALYSRNISTFWDVQIGIRYDTKPNSLGYLALGFEGLAPYFFETSAHLFLSEEGDVSARLHVENELLFTQRLILQPFLETTVYAKDVPAQERGAGLAVAEFGLQLRYEITRRFAPYIEVNYERAFSETAILREHRDTLRGILGVRILF